MGHGHRTTGQWLIKHRWAGVSVNIGGPRQALRALSGSINALTLIPIAHILIIDDGTTTESKLWG